jgi:hypothetical protein
MRRRENCGRCGEIRRVFFTPGICGECLGVDVGGTCAGCGLEDRIYSGGRCERCVLAERVAEVFDDCGDAGRAVAERLAASPSPGSSLIWLEKSRTAKILIDLLQHGREPAHEGISFKPMNMLFVPGGATLEQSVVRPRLRVPGLRGWIEELAAQIHPNMGIELSQAGRRAMILARLWGSRAAMAKDLLALNDFLREFRPNGASDSGAYPQRDGVRITPTEGYLTFDAAVRVLGEMKPDEIRERLNNLLRINVLQRGLIVPCGECERRVFYRMDALREMNTCPRSGAAAYSSAARRTSIDKSEEPGWFYDLHGAVREFLEQDGDVPVLAGWALVATARAFEDIPELDFRFPGAEDPDEIDIAALVDGRVVIGEAKRIASLGTRRETNRAVQKLIRVSDLVSADEIVLATTAPGPWEDLATGQLPTATAGHRWRFGTVPRIRVLTDLRGNPQNTLLN